MNHADDDPFAKRYLFAPRRHPRPLRERLLPLLTLVPLVLAIAAAASSVWTTVRWRSHVEDVRRVALEGVRTAYRTGFDDARAMCAEFVKTR